MATYKVMRDHFNSTYEAVEDYGIPGIRPHKALSDCPYGKYECNNKTAVEVYANWLNSETRKDVTVQDLREFFREDRAICKKAIVKGNRAVFTEDGKTQYVYCWYKTRVMRTILWNGTVINTQSAIRAS